MTRSGVLSQMDSVTRRRLGLACERSNPGMDYGVEQERHALFKSGHYSL